VADTLGASRGAEPDDGRQPVRRRRVAAAALATRRVDTEVL